MRRVPYGHEELEFMVQPWFDVDVVESAPATPVGDLGAAVRALAERMDGTNGSRVYARTVTSNARFAPEVEAGAYTVLREAANNAVKTGRAPNVALDVVDDAGGIVGLVEDDGRGFDVAATLASYATRGSLGLLQMREAARLIGAAVVDRLEPGQRDAGAASSSESRPVGRTDRLGAIGAPSQDRSADDRCDHQRRVRGRLRRAHRRDPH